MSIWQWLRSLFGRRYRLYIRHDSRRGKEVVVLLHGIAASGDVWTSTYQQLSKKYRVIVVDLLGFGDSPMPLSSEYEVVDHVRAVRYTLNRAGIKDVYLMGHSMGAIIALNYAISYPSSVKGVVCVSLPTYETRQGSATMLRRYRTNAYIRLYEAMISHPEATWSITQAIMRGLGSKTGLKLDKESLVSFQRSLRNTISPPECTQRAQ